MNAPPTLALLTAAAVALLVATVAGPAQAAAAPATPAPQRSAPSESPGRQPACAPGTPCPGVDRGPGLGLGGRLMSSAGNVMLRSVVSLVVNGAAWLLKNVVGLLEQATVTDVQAGWFRGAYRDMAALAVQALLPFLILAALGALLRQDLAGLARAAAAVPVAALGTGAALVLTAMLVALTDAWSVWIAARLGGDLSRFATGVGTAVTVGSGGLAAPFALLLGGALVASASLVLWLELLVRQAAIYASVLFLPMAFAAMVWPATAHWLKRLVHVLVAVILSKLVIVAVLSLGAAAADANVTADGFGTVVAGAALLLLATYSPFALLRLIPVWEAGAASQLESMARRPRVVSAAARYGIPAMYGLTRMRLASSAARAAVPPAAGAAGTAAAMGAVGGATAGLGATAMVGSSGARGARRAGATAGHATTQTGQPAAAAGSGGWTSDGAGRPAAPSAPPSGSTARSAPASGSRSQTGAAPASSAAGPTAPTEPPAPPAGASPPAPARDRAAWPPRPGRGQ